MYGNHAVALGFVILFNPMIAAIVLAYVHLLFFVGFIVASIMYKTRVAGVMQTRTYRLI
jgi:hypothetical protein